MHWHWRLGTQHINLWATVQSVAILLVYVVAIVFVHHGPVSAPPSCGPHRDALAVTPSEASLSLATVTGPGRPSCLGWAIIDHRLMHGLACDSLPATANTCWDFSGRSPWEPFLSTAAELASCCSRKPLSSRRGCAAHRQRWAKGSP